MFETTATKTPHRWINPSDSLNIDESDTIQLPPTPGVLEDFYLFWNSARSPHPESRLALPVLIEVVDADRLVVPSSGQ